MTQRRPEVSVLSQQQSNASFTIKCREPRPKEIKERAKEKLKSKKPKLRKSQKSKKPKLRKSWEPIKYRLYYTLNENDKKMRPTQILI